MAGYYPAGPPPFIPPRRKSWWQRHRDRKAEKKKAWMKFLGGLVMSPHERNQFCAFVDSMSTDDILCKSGDESWRVVNYGNF